LREGHSLINYFMTDFTAILSATCTNKIIPPLYPWFRWYYGV